MTPRSPFWRIWRWPIALGLLTAIGLVSALFSDGGPGDVIAWGALGLPLVLAGWLGIRRR